MSAVNERADQAQAPVPAPPSRAAPPTPAVLPGRSQQLLLRTLPVVRYRLLRLGWPGLAGIGLMAASVAVAIALLVPVQRSVVDLRAQIAQSAHAIPGAPRAEQSVHQFSSGLPTRDQVPVVLGVVIAQAEAAGVVLDQGRYSYSAPTSNRLARYTMEFPVKGDYANVRNFIDRSLKEVPALGLDKLRVERKNVGDMAVSADVGFVIYLRGS